MSLRASAELASAAGLLTPELGKFETEMLGVYIGKDPVVLERQLPWVPPADGEYFGHYTNEAADVIKKMTPLEREQLRVRVLAMLGR